MADIIHGEIGAHPADWSIQRVDSLFDIQQGKSVSKAHREGDNQKPFLRTKNVLWGRIDLTELDQMHFTSAEEARLRLRAGDLLLCEGGDVGRTAIWNDEMMDCYYQNHLHRLRARAVNEVDPQFALFWFWYAFEVGNIYIGRSNVTTIPNLSQSKLSELQIPKPKVDEQRRIANVLGTVQAAIEQQTRLIVLTCELKAALMRKLFTEGLRGDNRKETEIGPVPEHWDVVAFTSVIEIKSGQVDPREEPYRSMLHVGPENIESNTGRLSNVHTNRERRIISGNYFFTPDDVLYAKINPYLNKVAMPDFEGTCSADMYPLRPNRDSFDKAFLFQLLLSDVFTKQSISFQDRTGIPKINRNQLCMILLPKPKLPEQGEIARILATYDAKHNMMHHKRSSLKELFRTLLHELMTGQTRVNEIDLPGLS